METPILKLIEQIPMAMTLGDCATEKIRRVGQDIIEKKHGIPCPLDYVDNTHSLYNYLINIIRLSQTKASLLILDAVQLFIEKKY